MVHEHFSDSHEQELLGADREPFWTGRRKFLAVALSLVALLVAVVFFKSRSSPSVDDHPASDRLRAGQVAFEQGDFQRAIEYFAEAEAEGGELPVAIVYDRADALLSLGHSFEAEQQLRKLLEREPEHVAANELLSGLLRVGGRNWEIRPLFLAQVRQRIYSAANLAAITSSENFAVNRGPPQETELEQSILRAAAQRNDLLAELGQARQFLGENALEKALPLLTRVVKVQPELLDVQARFGAALLDTNRLDELPDWHRALPANASSHPDIWMVRGRWLEVTGERASAARCYWETLRRFPDHPTATYRLSQMLYALNRPEQAAAFAERAGEINKIQTAIATGWDPPSNVQHLTERLESLGRLWEALAWCELTVEWTPKDVADIGWAHERKQRLLSRIQPDMPLVLDEMNLAAKYDLSDLPLHPWPQSEGNRTPEPNGSPIAKTLRFADQANEAGIAFSYHNGADPERAYMFEFGGGGVAVLDYDGDAWPDIYLTQGRDWPVDSPQEKYTDRLFRNLGNGHFEDVTQQAGLKSTGFGQGVTVGDLDNDGWPDLYVANIGANQLYRNNGDGTFTDITSTAGITAAQWTLSAFIADLDGDTNPEIYDVNYLGGPEVFTKICYSNEKPTQCFPNQFPGEPDRLYRSLGNGRFQDITDESGVGLIDGKGMGAVAADFDASGRLSFFISNDTTNNYFFLNETAAAGSKLKLSERALSSGLAVGESGTAQSCMGIAAGDIDGDTRLDLFVTNFRDEANNLFMQVDSLLFDDRIRAAGLHDPGYPYEGWGAQFLDVDLDGRLELAVANGHLDDYPHSSGLTRMPTQVFYNLGSGRFAEAPAAELGPYFEVPRLGRALARLDWNRDGKVDFCVTHVESPFALLTNRTETTGNYLMLHLRGTQSARDAIGAVVTVRAGDDVWTQQLIAGDGFQASNQRCLMFGLGSRERVDEVEIRWPSGVRSNASDFSANTEFICIEGTSELTPMHLISKGR